MTPEREIKVNGRVVREFYWNGGFPVSVDYAFVEGSYEEVIARLEQEASDGIV